MKYKYNKRTYETGSLSGITLPDRETHIPQKYYYVKIIINGETKYYGAMIDPVETKYYGDMDITDKSHAKLFSKESEAQEIVEKTKIKLKQRKIGYSEIRVFSTTKKLSEIDET